MNARAIPGYGHTRGFSAPAELEAASALTGTVSEATTLSPSRMRTAILKASISFWMTEILTCRLLTWFSLSFIASWMLIIVFSWVLAKNTRIHRHSDELDEKFHYLNGSPKARA